MIPLKRALRLGPAPQLAFVGAGGKTVAMFILAHQFDVPVLLTTSTHLREDQARQADQHFRLNGPAEVRKLDAAKLPAISVLTGEPARDGRLPGLAAETMAALSAFTRQKDLPLLIEADGARQLAFKAPAEHEPAIPSFVDTVVVLAGLSALGKPLDKDNVHRPERVSQLSGLGVGTVVTSEAVTAVLLHPDGGLRNIPAGARRVVLLNQADTPELVSAASRMSPALLTSFDSVLVAALGKSPQVSAVHEPVAGILLAAGGSGRLGRPKQLLDWKGKPFVRNVAETALAAGLDPLVVVTGDQAAKTEAVLGDLDVVIARNDNWREGQSSSVKTGLAALPPRVGAALFMVVDQPQLPLALIESLRAEHAASLAPIVAPLVDGHRSNPVLFDRATFPDFEAVQGDTGGRAIFSKHQVVWLPWLDISLAIDVDTPEDYDRLLRQAG